jgi:hypothetical protein
MAAAAVQQLALLRLHPQDESFYFDLAKMVFSDVAD